MIEIDFIALEKTANRISFEKLKNIIIKNINLIKEKINNFNINSLDKNFDNKILSNQLSAILALVVNVKREISELAENYDDSLLANTVIDLIHQACEKELTSFQLVTTPLKPSPGQVELVWLEHKLYFEQKFLTDDAEIKSLFSSLLATLKEFIHRNCRLPESIFFSHAWSDSWDEEFLITLREHLHIAGLTVANLDVKDNAFGNNIYEFMEKAQTDEFVLLFGTPDLLRKHKAGTHAIATELVNIKRKRKADSINGDSKVIPILIKGSMETSFPPEYELYTNIHNWINENSTYLKNFKILLARLCRAKETIFDLYFKNFIDSVENKHKRLVLEFGLEKDAVLQKITVEELKLAQAKHKKNKASKRVLSGGKNKESNTKGLINNSFFESISPNTNCYHWNIPRLNENFVGRKNLLNRIKNEFLSHRSVALVAFAGLGGVGKTELARYFIQTESGYKFKFWFNAENIQLLREEYLKCAINLKLCDKSTNEDEAVELLKEWFECHQEWMIVYDNAEQFNTLKKYIPSRGGHVLVTSRNQNWQTTIIIEPLSESEAISLIEKITKLFNQPLTKLLVNKLDRLPLALAQAAAYILRRKKTIEDYLALYDKERANMLSSAVMPIDCEHEPVFVTWDINFQAIREEAEYAYYLLNYLAYLYPVDIPRNYLINLLPPLSVSSKEPELIIDDAIEILLKYSMIKADHKNISIHRLVQQVIWEKQKSANIQTDVLLRVLNTIQNLSDEANDPLVLGGAAENTECLDDIILCYETMLEEKPADATLCHNLGCCYLVKNNFAQAEAYFKKAIELDGGSVSHAEYAQALYLVGRLVDTIQQCIAAINSKEDSYLYFSEMEKPTVDSLIQEEIVSAGIVRIKASQLAHYLIIKSYLQLNNQSQAILYWQKFSEILQAVPDGFSHKLFSSLGEIKPQPTTSLRCGIL